MAIRLTYRPIQCQLRKLAMLMRERRWLGRHIVQCSNIGDVRLQIVAITRCSCSEYERDGRLLSSECVGPQRGSSARNDVRAGADVNSIDPSLPSQNLRQHTTTLSRTAAACSPTTHLLIHPQRFRKDGASKYPCTTRNSFAATCTHFGRHEQLAMGSVVKLGFGEQGCRIHNCGYNTGCRCWWCCVLLLQ